MPHVDEMLGVTTVASAGLFLALAFQPAEGMASAGVKATAETLQTMVATASAALDGTRYAALPRTR